MYAADMDKAELQRRLRNGSLGEKLGGAATLIGENVIGGFVDDYDSIGERLGSGINAFAKLVATDPVGVVKGAAEGIAGLVKQASNPNDIEGSARAAVELATMVPVAGATTALATGSRLADLVEYDPDTLRSFIGPKGAKMLADEGDSSAVEALEHAAALEEVGADYNQIRALVNDQIAETNPYFGGISKNAAGQWVVEVDDRLTVSRPGVARKVMDQGIAEGTVDELIVGSGLPRQMLRDTQGEFKYGPDEGGRRSDGSVYATSKSMQQGVPVMMHEMDHVSMRLEGNAPGGAPGHVLTGRYVPTASDYDKIIAILEMEPGSAIRDNLFATMTDTQRRAYDLVLGGAGGDELMALDTARKGADIMRRGNISQEIYNRLSGEVQARNVMTRMRMTPEERRATDPVYTEDYPRSEQVNQGPDGYQMLARPFDPREYAKGGGVESGTPDMVGVDPDSPYYDKVLEAVSKLEGLPLLLMKDEAAERNMTLGQYFEDFFIKENQVKYTKYPEEAALMDKPLDNTEADMLARAYALAEDEYMVGVAPTNINPLFEIGTRDGKHRGMFGSLPLTGKEVIYTAPNGEQIKTAGYTLGNRLVGERPFLATHKPSRATDDSDNPNQSSRGLSPELEQQLKRQVLSDPYLATPEILAHEAGHGGANEFIRARLNDLLPLMREQKNVNEYLVELFEPVSMSEGTTDTGATDASRAAVQAYLRGEAVDRDLISPALQQALDSLIAYQQGTPEGSRPRPRLREFSQGGGVASLNSVARNMTRGPRGLSGFIPYMKGY